MFSEPKKACEKELLRNVPERGSIASLLNDYGLSGEQLKELAWRFLNAGLHAQQKLAQRIFGPTHRLQAPERTSSVLDSKSSESCAERKAGTCERPRAFLKFLVSSAAAALWVWFAFGSGNFKPRGFVAIVASLPLVPPLVFGLELITGLRFSELESRWNALTGWQRGVLGPAIVLIIGAILYYVAVFVLRILL